METSTKSPALLIQDSILPATIKLAAPVLIGHILELTYAIADTFFLSMIDSESTAIISGVGLILPIYMLVIAIGTGIFAGTGSVVARAFGGGKQIVANQAMASSFFLSLILGSVMVLVLGFGGEALVGRIAGERISSEAISHGVIYLRFFLPGMLALLLFFSIAGSAQGVGLVKYYALAMILSTTGNIILDPLFIFGLRLGVHGASIATSVSIFLSLCFLIIRFTSDKTGLNMKIRLHLYSGARVREMLSIAIPQFISLSTISLGLIVLNFFVGSISETRLNSWVLVGRMDEIIFIFGYALANATLTLVGQAFGNCDMSRVRKIYRTNLLVTISIGLIAALIYNSVARPLFSMFSSIEDVINGSVFQTRVVAFSFIGVLVTLVSNSTLQAIGKPLPGLILNVFRMMILIIPPAFISIMILNRGILTLFVIVVCGNLIAMACAIVWTTAILNRV